jgi:hypothetical protein
MGFAERVGGHVAGKFSRRQFGRGLKAVGIYQTSKRDKVEDPSAQVFYGKMDCEHEAVYQATFFDDKHGEKRAQTLSGQMTGARTGTARQLKSRKCEWEIQTCT